MEFFWGASFFFFFFWLGWQECQVALFYTTIFYEESCLWEVFVWKIWSFAFKISFPGLAVVSVSYILHLLQLACGTQSIAQFCFSLIINLTSQHRYRFFRQSLFISLSQLYLIVQCIAKYYFSQLIIDMVCVSIFYCWLLWLNPRAQGEHLTRLLECLVHI